MKAAAFYAAGIRASGSARSPISALHFSDLATLARARPLDRARLASPRARALPRHGALRAEARTRASVARPLRRYRHGTLRHRRGLRPRPGAAHAATRIELADFFARSSRLQDRAPLPRPASPHRPRRLPPRPTRPRRRRCLAGNRRAALIHGRQAERHACFIAPKTAAAASRQKHSGSAKPLPPAAAAR